MPEDPILIVDGHTHITNRVYWEKIDPWKPQAFGFDYARAYDAGVRVVIENISPYGYNNFNYTPKQVLRLIETFHRVLEQHSDRMGLVLRAGDARKIVAAGKMAVVLSVESGFDHEGDLDVLRSLFRLGLRGVQFATQTCFNAFADSSVGGPGIWSGINFRGHKLVELMNELGILIDVTHASQEAQAQVIAASDAPVVASHVAMEAVSGDGTPGELMSDEVLRALSAKGRHGWHYRCLNEPVKTLSRLGASKPVETSRRSGGASEDGGVRFPVNSSRSHARRIRRLVGFRDARSSFCKLHALGRSSGIRSGDPNH